MTEHTKPTLDKRFYRQIIFILGFISMLMPLSIDMYLPSLPQIGLDYGVSDGLVQLTISTYLVGFGVGQLIYGPISDSVGRKPVILFGLCFFLLAAAGCALSQTINQLIGIRFLHGFAGAACAVVVNALLRDLFDKEELSRTMSFVTLIMTIAPLLAPIVGGWLIIWFSWHSVFWVLFGAALFVTALVIFYIPETLPQEKRVRLSLFQTFYRFVLLFRQRTVLCYMLAGAFSGAGLFSFLSFGSFVYMNLYGVRPEHFGYYFAINILALIVLTSINSRFVKQWGVHRMLKLGLFIQGTMSLFLIIAAFFDWGLIALVIGVAGYMGCISMIGSNLMVIILSEYAYMSGTVSSLAGTLRFFIASLIVFALSQLLITNDVSSHTGASHFSEWLMVGSMAMCSALASFFCYIAYRRAATKSSLS